MVIERTTKLERFILWVGVILIFLPKINIISVSGQSAGLRIDDLILMLIFAFVCFSKKFKKKSEIEQAFLIMICFWVFSNLLNITLFSRSNLLYSLRYIEYFMFFYVGILFSRKYSIHTFIFYLVGINAIVIFLQLNGLLGGFSSEGAVSDVSSRAIGLTGGPWEIGAMLNFCFAIFAFDTHKKHKKIKVIIFYIVTFVLILATASRMPMLAHLILLLIYVYKESSNKLFFILYTSALALIILGVFLSFSKSISDRSENTFSGENINIFINSYKSVVIRDHLTEFPEFEYDDMVDYSWFIRMSKWTYAIKYWLNVPIAWLFGVGPGTWGIALDGGILRLITETGIIGSILFIRFLKKCASTDFSLVLVVLALVISMLMIDIHISYKSMALLLFAVGYFYNVRQRNLDIKINDG